MLLYNFFAQVEKNKVTLEERFSAQKFGKYTSNRPYIYCTSVLLPRKNHYTISHPPCKRCCRHDYVVLFNTFWSTVPTSCDVLGHQRSRCGVVVVTCTLTSCHTCHSEIADFQCAVTIYKQV